ncbi:MAG TPA: hypothetical protein PK014_04445 [Thermoanaerobaculia bacterium]|nr:hypothetical protein [Thermoanaerobaculia bacterium]HUM29306.1 hypothetical protein [Thermoanaerobaculia bacterium]HXK67736.1 hypothetical protein [Thermoanaerobaculia bacterium]
MSGPCREFRERLTKGLADWNDYNHVEECHACELWLQEHINFRRLQLTPPETEPVQVRTPECETFLEQLAHHEYRREDQLSTSCPRCETTARTLYALRDALSNHLTPSKALRSRIYDFQRPKTSFFLQALQIAAALLLAALLTFFTTPLGKFNVDAQKGNLSKRVVVELSLAKAYLYKIYGEARGRLAMTLAQNPSDEEEKNEMPVPSGK